MNSSPSQDPIEQLLGELRSAEQSGLFARTKLPDVIATPPVALFARATARRWLAGVAAVLFLAVGVWTAMFASQLSDLRHRAQLASSGPRGSPSPALVRTFAACLAGPEADPLVPGCLDQDLNADHRVDLRDYSSFLLASAGSPQ